MDGCYVLRACLELPVQPKVTQCIELLLSHIFAPPPKKKKKKKKYIYIDNFPVEIVKYAVFVFTGIIVLIYILSDFFAFCLMRHCTLCV